MRQGKVGRAPSATTHSWSSIESSLLTGETATRCTVARGPGAGDDWGKPCLKEHVLKEPGGGEGPEGGDARLAPASASACRERASGGALLESSCRTGSAGNACEWGGAGRGAGGVRGNRPGESYRLLRVEAPLALLPLGPERAGVAIPVRGIHAREARLARPCGAVDHAVCGACPVGVRCLACCGMGAWGEGLAEYALGVLGLEVLLDLLRSLDVHRALVRRQRLPVHAQQHGHRSVGPGCRRGNG